MHLKTLKSCLINAKILSIKVSSDLNWGLLELLNYNFDSLHDQLVISNQVFFSCTTNSDNNDCLCTFDYHFMS